MKYLACLIVLICSTTLATAGMFDAFQNMAGEMMKNVMGGDNPMAKQMQQVMQAMQGGGGMEEIQKKMQEMMTTATQMTGAGTEAMKQMAEKAMEGFNKLKESGAGPDEMKKQMQGIMQQMQQMGG